MIRNAFEAWKALSAVVGSDFLPNSCTEFEDCYAIGIRGKGMPVGVATGLTFFRVDKATEKVTCGTFTELGIWGNPLARYDVETFQPI